VAGSCDGIGLQNESKIMRKTFLAVLLVSLFVAGCSNHYQITLNNGNRITTLGKPKFENGYYRFQDINGQTNWISTTRVRQIEPQPRGYSEDNAFKPSKR
jgi:hypothetical protein